jgi:hypothetical protein
MSKDGSLLSREERDIRDLDPSQSSLDTGQIIGFGQRP